MIIYIITFAVSCLFTYIAEKYITKSKKIFVLLSLFAILLPSIIAGVRDITIGYDVGLYGVNYFQLAVNSDSFAEYRAICDTDFGYAALNYIVSRVTDNIHWFLFVIEFIIVVLVYLFAYSHREKHPMWLTMLAFFTIFYSNSLNILRQSLALAIIIFGTRYAENSKFLKYLITTIIATMFHATAIVALPIYFLFKLENLKRKNTYKVFTVLIIVFIMFNFFSIIETLVNMGILSNRFLSYVYVFSENATDFGYIEGTLRLAIIFICLITYKSKIQFDHKNATYIYMLIIDFMLMQLTLISGSAQRLAYYYGYPALLYMIPQLTVGFKNDKSNKWIINSFTIILLLAYWYLQYVYQNFGSTYPYTSIILGI